jgi:ABC-2 type transport system ATP-binding protein
MAYAIDMEGVDKAFGVRQAVRDFTLRVPRGALFGFIGPNGAGKTTTLRMVLSMLLPDRGRIAVLGESSALAAKDRIGYLPEERGVYKKMRVDDFLVFMAQLKGLRGPALRPRVLGWLERVGLEDAATKRCEDLSKGMQQKVQFIASVIHEPELLVLDEPFSGLDPVGVRAMRELFLEQRQRGATLLFSTHQMHHAEQVCEHIVMIHAGRKVLDDPMAAIRSRVKATALAFEPLDDAADVRGALVAVPGLRAIERSDGPTWRLALSSDADLSRTVQAVAACLAPARLEVVRPGLEDIFVEIAGMAEAAKASR